VSRVVERKKPHVSGGRRMAASAATCGDGGRTTLLRKTPPLSARSGGRSSLPIQTFPGRRQVRRIKSPPQGRSPTAGADTQEARAAIDALVVAFLAWFKGLVGDRRKLEAKTGSGCRRSRLLPDGRHCDQACRRDRQRAEAIAHWLQVGKSIRKRQCATGGSIPLQASTVVPFILGCQNARTFWGLGSLGPRVREFEIAGVFGMTKKLNS